jgi:CBS-domain-containing membrane protein
MSISDAIRFIATGHERTVVVVEPNNRLYGVISQGDIIKSLWNGHELSSPIDSCININPLTIDFIERHPDEKAKSIFVQSGALIIPVIDEERQLREVISIRRMLEKEIS